VTIACATGNRGKLREFQLAGEMLGIRVEPLAAFPAIPPCEETGATFEENARLKAAYYRRHAGDWLFAEDSGLEVDALGGAPGLYSARFAGDGATDEENNRRLLELMHGQTNRAARFVCVVAVAHGAEIRATFQGVVEGVILDQPRGSEGFGYDPLFYYPPFGCSFGEAPRDRKAIVSHRGQAGRAMFQWLRSREREGGTPRR
jgi:XTP/dITP diphosphohydrolase